MDEEYPEEQIAEAPEVQNEKYPAAQSEPVPEQTEEASQQTEQIEIDFFDEEPAVCLTPQRYREGRLPRTEKKEKPKKEKKTVSSVWVPVLLVIALLFGAFGGVLGYSVASGRNIQLSGRTGAEDGGITLPTTEDPAKPDHPSISGKVRTNGDGEGKTPADIYSENVGAVVGIASSSEEKNAWGQTVKQASAGSGFILTSDGYVVTNYHVVEDASSIKVQLYDGREFPASIVGYENAICDVALLKIDATDLQTVAVGDSDKVVTGEEVCAIGNPLGELTFTLTVGYISAVDREVNTEGTPINMFQTDAAINAGNSGGPLFDMNGNVIGITTAKYSGSTYGGTTVEGLGFAIPINDVMKIIDDLTQYGYVTGRPYLGVTVSDPSNYDEELPAGAYVVEVQSGFAAEKAGIQAGDVIVGLDKTVIRSRTELTEALRAYHAGDTVSLTVYRGGQYLDLTLTLSERPRDTESTEEETEEPSEPLPFEIPLP